MPQWSRIRPRRDCIRGTAPRTSFVVPFLLRLDETLRHDGFPTLRLRRNDGADAEPSVCYEQIAHLNAFLDEINIGVIHAERDALFLAAKAFRRCRAHGGTRTVYWRISLGAFKQQGSHC
jgi:hypothetical protein